MEVRGQLYVRGSLPPLRGFELRLSAFEGSTFASYASLQASVASLLTLLPLPPECWDYRCVLLGLVYVVL